MRGSLPHAELGVIARTVEIASTDRSIPRRGRPISRVADTEPADDDAAAPAA
jgi:hypothetical protein